MAERKEPLETRDFGWMVAMSFVFFALVAYGFYREFRTEWRPYQLQFVAVLGQTGHADDARDFHVGIKQIWIPKIGVTDRCITCHLGYEYAAVLPISIREPLKPHPTNDWLDKHEFAKFGCTPCHGGDGWAVTGEGAHVGGEGWDDPVLSTAIASRNGLTMNEMMQMRCNFCHRHDAATPGMDEINLAKQLYKKKKCVLCHVVEGRGGATGPELTYYGDKNPELLNFAHVIGDRTMFNWNVQHLTHAGAVSPRTQMPDFNFPPAQARALALMLMSWRRISYSAEYIPDPAAAAAAMTPAPSASPSAAPSHIPSR
jgi:Cytochrome c